jgi:hypothetical protein
MAQSYRGKPTLDECRARILRAMKHIEGLERELASVRGTADRWTIYDPAGLLVTPDRRGYLGIPDINIPPVVRILIGETLYNLRTALDYLVSQLFYLATGKFDSGTKFLIE